MAARHLAFFPRFTTLAGGSPTGKDYYSEAIEVVPYASLVVEFMLEGRIGTGATVKMQLQEGSDLETFSNSGTEEMLTTGTPAVQTYSGTSRFVRVRVNLSTSSGFMAATLWALGVARES